MRPATLLANFAGGCWVARDQWQKKTETGESYWVIGA